MKTKSKLVLGLSILSAATLAAGATSTFAWYTATAGNVSIDGDKSVSSITAGVSEFANTNLHANFSATTISDLVLSNDSDKTYGWVGGRAVEANVPDGYHLTHSLTLTFSAAGDDDAKAASGTYYIVLAKTGAAKTSDENHTADKDLYAAVQIQNDGTVSESADVATIYFSLAGADSDQGTSGVTGSVTATMVADYNAEGTYSVGDFVVYSNVVYKCNTAIGTAETWTPAHWTACTALTLG